MTPPQARMRDLRILIGELSELHERLSGLIQQKIDAMKRADMHAMHEISQDEQAVAAAIAQRDGLRRQLADAVGVDAGLSKRASRDLTARELAKHFPAEHAKPFVELATALRERVERVARLNHVAGTISNEVLRHLKWVMGAVRRGQNGVVGYGGSGAPVGAAERQIFDAVG